MCDSGIDIYIREALLDRDGSEAEVEGGDAAVVSLYLAYFILWYFHACMYGKAVSKYISHPLHSLEDYLTLNS